MSREDDDSIPVYRRLRRRKHITTREWLRAKRLARSIETGARRFLGEPNTPVVRAVFELMVKRLMDRLLPF